MYPNFNVKGGLARQKRRLRRAAYAPISDPQEHCSAGLSRTSPRRSSERDEPDRKQKKAKTKAMKRTANTRSHGSRPMP